MLLEITRADGVFMYGPNGEKYLDLISGVSVSNTGHRHPEVISAIRDQAESYSHLMVYGEIIQSPQVKYASLLASELPDKLQSCYFVNSGSEAVEGALKLAKKYTGRSRIISFRNSYHGSTHGALSIQGSETYKNAFRPLLPDTFLAEFNNMEALELVDEKTACVVIEPVQAEAGVISAEPEFLKELYKRCQEKGALLIFDEIQTGFGRTGTLWAFQRYGVVPDILLLAKALGGGMPLGAFISSGKIMSALASGPALGHITTFGGHPVCCAAGYASLKVILNNNLADNCLRRSEQFKSELQHPLIKTVKGQGLLLAAEPVKPGLVQKIVTKAPEHGLILDYFLFCQDAFRIAPPLTISSEEVSLACNLIKELLVSVMNNQ
jgi:acetylornithine/succinyldiaminopimelate/putrescine aminotransferase